LRDAVGQLERRLPKIAALLDEAEADVLAFFAFPAEHWPKIRSTNPLERFNREIARRTDVVGIFPDDASLIRLVSMLAIEANDEWLVGRSYISQKSMATLSDACRRRISLEIKTRRSSSSRPEPPTASPTNARAASYTTPRDLTGTLWRRISTLPRRWPRRCSSGACIRWKSPCRMSSTCRPDAARKRIGMSEDALRSDVGDYEACQAVGAAAHQLGLAGVVAPAATGLGETLALFSLNAAIEDWPQITASDIWHGLPPDPRPLRLADDFRLALRQRTRRPSELIGETVSGDIPERSQSRTTKARFCGPFPSG
jgi:Transposase, Mutator family